MFFNSEVPYTYTIACIGVFTVMCYNVLCDKYATKQQYGYCPSWALSWEYRKKNILDELKQSNSDVIALQEVETDQYYNYFLPALKEQDYEGIFSPKSRARTISESERKHVDGCAIFYRKSKSVLNLTFALVYFCTFLWAFANSLPFN